MIFIQRIISWNAKRYDSIFDVDLAYKLLKEEVLELLDAKTEVDQLDALVDTIYIAIGAMWKMGLSAEQIQAAILVVCNANDSKVVVKTEPHIKANQFKGENFVPPEEKLQEILNERV